MAEKLERIYTVRISKAYNYPRITRARRAVNLLRKFVARHMKAAEVSISNVLNAEVWRNGIERPPRTVKIKAVKEGDVAKAYLFGEEEASAARQKKKEGDRKASMDKRKGRAKKIKPGAGTKQKAAAPAGAKETAAPEAAQRKESPGAGKKSESAQGMAPKKAGPAAVPAKKEQEKAVQQ